MMGGRESGGTEKRREKERLTDRDRESETDRVRQERELYYPDQISAVCHHSNESPLSLRSHLLMHLSLSLSVSHSQ